MALWAINSIYVTNQPPGVNDGLIFKPSEPRVPYVKLPCVKLSERDAARLAAGELSWDVLRKDVAAAVAPGVQEVVVYGPSFEVLRTWTRAELEAA